MTLLKAVLIGPGGVGSVVALALDHSRKVEVTVVARSSYDILSLDGFNFNSVDYGEVQNWRPHRVSRTVEEAAAYKPYDYIIVCTKCIPEVFRTEDLIRPLVGPGTTVVLIQNGVGNEAPVMKAYPDSYVVGGVTNIGATYHSGNVRHVSSDRIALGTFDQRPEAIEAAKRFADIYNSTKSEAVFTDDLGYRRWWKLFYNATINTSAALTGLDSSRLAFAGLIDNVVAPAMTEVRAIAEADLGEKIAPNAETTWLTLVRNLGKYYEPSMLVDVKKGQIMELEVILGNPLRIAARHRIEAPILSMLYKALRGIQFRLYEKNGRISVPAEPFDRSEAKPLEF